MNEAFLILWHMHNDGGEYEIFIGSLDDAIVYVKSEDRWKNYDRKGATINAIDVRYKIITEVKERIYVTSTKPETRNNL